MSYSRNLSADLIWNTQSQSYVRAPSKIYTTYVELHANTYYNCQTITHVDAANTPWVNNTMRNAFENCNNLQSVTNINPNVTNMAAAFMNCSKLTATPILPASVVELTSTFYGCSNITTMPTIPGNITDMSYAFMYCNNMSTTTAIPNSVTDIRYAFTYTNINTSPVLPQNLTKLDYTYAFCKNLNTAPIIPENIGTLIGTFQSCEKIQSAPTIPNSVYDLSYTFSSCHNLTGNIYVKSNQITNANDCFLDTSLTKNVYIPFYEDQTTQLYGWTISGTTYYTLSATPANGATVYDGNGNTTIYTVKNATESSIELEVR